MFQKRSGKKKKLWTKKRLSRFCVGNACLTVTKKINRGPLLCLKRILVLNLFLHRRREYITSVWSFFLSQYQKKLVGGTLVFQKRYGKAKKLWIKERVSRFSVGYL